MTKKKSVKAKARTTVSHKAKDTSVLRELVPLAKEANARYELADKAIGKANDHRLAAAIQLSKAQKICKQHKIGWEKWVKENVNFAVKTVRELISYANAKDPVKAIDDGRKDAAKRNRKSRAVVKERRNVTPVKQITATDFTTADAFLASLDDKTQLAVVKSRCENLGFGIMKVSKLKKLSEDNGNGKIPIASRMDQLMAGFLALGTTDQAMFLKKAADVIGAQVELGAGPDLTDIPADMRR